MVLFLGRRSSIIALVDDNLHIILLNKVLNLNTTLYSQTLPLYQYQRVRQFILYVLGVVAKSKVKLFETGQFTYRYMKLILYSTGLAFLHDEK